MKFWNGPNISGTLDVSSHVHFPGLTTTNKDHVVCIDTTTGKLHYKELKTGNGGPHNGTHTGGHVPISHGGTGLVAVGNEGDILTTNNGTIKWVSGNTTRDWSVDQTGSNIHTGNYSNDNTQLTGEQVADFVGGMLSGTQSEIAVTYDDETGNLEFNVSISEDTKREEKASQEEAEDGVEDTKAMTALRTKQLMEAKRVHELAAPTAAFSMNSQKITSLGTPTEDTDAASKSYVDGAVVTYSVQDGELSQNSFTNEHKSKVTDSNRPMLIGSGIGYVPGPGNSTFYMGNATYGWNHHSWAGTYSTERDGEGAEDWAGSAPVAGDTFELSEDRQNCGQMIPVKCDSFEWKVMVRATASGEGEELLCWMAKADRINEAANNKTQWTILAVSEVELVSGQFVKCDIQYDGTLTTDTLLILGFGINGEAANTAMKMSHQLFGYKK